MGNHSSRSLAVGLACALIAAGCQQRETAAEVPRVSPAELDGLIAQVGDSRVSDTVKVWAAAARLQKLGEPAIAALIAHLRQDPFGDPDHGNHSQTMKVLEKIGEPALPALAGALTATLLQSRAVDDDAYVRSVTMVMARIDRSRAAPSLIRVARSAVDIRLRVEALYEILGPDGYPRTLSRPSRWEPCFAVEYWSAFGSRIPCPDGSEATRLTMALRPMLSEISALLEEAPAPDLQLAAAHLLARWGTDDLKSQGERELLALATGEASEVRTQAVQALGILRVRSSVDRLRAQAVGADEELKLTIAGALFRLNDSGYFALVVDLMNSKDDAMRRWSIEFARASHNTAFVSSVIDRLQDRGWNGTTTTSSSAGEKETVVRQTLAEDAVEALRRLTFQNFGVSAEQWRQWWETNKSASWESLLNRFVQSRLMELPRAEPHIMNEWMDQLAEADSAAVLPLVAGVLNHPSLNLRSLGPNLFSGGGGAPRVLLLLLELVDQGSAGARQLLSQCLTAVDPSLRAFSPFAVAVFDRKKSLDWLVEQLKDRDPDSAAKAARSLVHMGDRRGIPRLIDELSATDQTQSHLAFITLKHYTQEDIPFDPDAPVAVRREMSKRWRQWWHDQRTDFTVNVRAAQVDSEIFI